MATIRSREDQDGITIGWQAQIKRKGFPLQVKTFRTKAEATQWATVTESEMMRGVWRDRSRAESTTVTDLLDRYAREILPDKKSRQGPASVIRILKKSEIGKLSLAALTPEAIAKYRDRRLATMSEKTGRPLSTQTVRHEIAILSRIIAHAIKEWGIPLAYGNPCLQIKMPSQARARDRRLQGDEEARLLVECAKAKNPWLVPVVRFAIETAMRAGEMLETKGTADDDGERPIQSAGLLWKHVDLNKRVALLPETKNGTARKVPLSSVVVEILRGLPRSMDGKVFGTSYEAIHLSFVRACKRAGIEDLRLHDLRHEATSRLFEKGLNPMQVAAITGHKTLQMLKRYTHLRAEDLAKLLG